MGITIVPEQSSLAITEREVTVNKLPESVVVEVETSQPAPQVVVRYGHDAVHILMSEIELSIRDVSLIELIEDNKALIEHEQIVRISEDEVIAKDILTIQGELHDPNTGNTALASAIETLEIELTNHDGSMTAHAGKFVELQASIDDVVNDVEANATAISGLTVDVQTNRDGISAIAQDIVELNADLSIQSGRIDAHGSAISTLFASVQSNEDGIRIQNEAMDTLEARLDNNISNVEANASAIDGINVLINDDENGLIASASRITELEAGISNNLNPAIAWEFNNDTEGWQAGDAATISQADDSLIINTDAGAGYAWVELDNPLSGETYPYVLVRWKRLSGSSWSGNVYYKYSGGPSTWTLGKSFTEVLGQLDFTSTTVDMRGTEWVNREITHIAIELSNAAYNNFALDSVGIGRVGALGPYAYIRDNLNAWVDEDSALAQRVTELEASVGNNAVSINEEITARVEGDDLIQGSYVLSIDVNGYVSGFGLMSQIIDGDPVSDFAVVADNFYVVFPGQTALTAPFKVGTYHNRPSVVMANAIVGDTIESENFDDRHGWQIKVAGSGQGNAIFSQIEIRDHYGNTVLSSGEGLQWEKIQGAEKPADGATRNFIYRRTSTPTGAREGDFWYNPSTKILRRYTGWYWDEIGTYTTHTSDLTDDANLGATAVWSQIHGPGKPQDYADVTAQGTAQGIFNQGLFATLDKITKDNIYTYMEEAVIGSAFIGELSVLSAHIGDLEVGTEKISNGAVSTLTSAFSKSLIYWTYDNDFRTLQSCGIISYEVRKSFLISCSATLLIPTSWPSLTEGGDDAAPCFIQWGVKYLPTQEFVYKSEMVEVSGGTLPLSFTFEHSPVETGPLVYSFCLYFGASSDGSGPIRVYNRSMFMAEFKK